MKYCVSGVVWIKFKCAYVHVSTGAVSARFSRDVDVCRGQSIDRARAHSAPGVCDARSPTGARRNTRRKRTRTRATHTRRSHEHTQTDAEHSTKSWLSDSPRPRASRRSRPARALPPVAPPRRRRSPLARSVTPRAFSPAMPSSPTPSSVAVTRASPTPARAVASSWRPRLRGTSSSRSRRGRRRRRRPSVRRSVPRCVVFSFVFFAIVDASVRTSQRARRVVQTRSGGWLGEDGREGVVQRPS